MRKGGNSSTIVTTTHTDSYNSGYYESEPIEISWVGLVIFILFILLIIVLISWSRRTSPTVIGGTAGPTHYHTTSYIPIFGGFFGGGGGGSRTTTTTSTIVNTNNNTTSPTKTPTQSRTRTRSRRR